MSPSKTPNSFEAEINIVGSSSFGRYPKISTERTYNMFVSDGWLVNFAGYKKARAILPNSQGRGIFRSVRGDFAIAVFNDAVFRIETNLNFTLIGNLETFTGEVFMDENLNSQICIVDGLNAYIFNYQLNQFAKTAVPSDLIPNYVTYQNGKLVIGNANKTNAGSQWYAFSSGGGTSFAPNPAVLTLQTKPDFALAALRIPGKGNNLLVLGSTVAEIWTDIGGSETYRRNASINIDYGLVSVSTLASSDEIICWLGINEKSEPSIMTMRGGSAERISTDGIDFLLQSIKKPEDSTAYFYRQDGHLFYQLTFFDDEDNISIVYDFNAASFYFVSDENLNHHPGRQIIFFNGTTYFIGLQDGNLYELSSFITNIEIDQTLLAIPRIRITKSIRLKDSSRFIANYASWTMEQGVEQNLTPLQECEGFILAQDGRVIFTEDGKVMLVQEGDCLPYRPRVDISLSKSGGETFSNIVSLPLNFTGNFQNQMRLFKMGAANDLIYQFRFWGLDRFVVNNGVLEMYQ